jgi:antitoxin VapB
METNDLVSRRRVAPSRRGSAILPALPEQRRVRLFRNGRNQAVRIPVEFEPPGDEAIMHRDGDRLVIEPVRKRGVVALLKTMKPLEEDFS